MEDQKRQGSFRRVPTSSHGCMHPDAYQVTYRSGQFTVDIHDPLLEWMHTVLLGCASISAAGDDVYRVVEIMEDSLTNHFENPSNSKLLSKIGPLKLFTKLPISEAFRKMDLKYRMTSRQFVPISIHECRQTFNLAQVLASSHDLKLITFDGDETLYPDGQNFEDAELSNLIIHILKSGCHIALVTAAGYGQKPEPYLVRLGRLIPDIIFATRKCPKVRSNFWVFGGESNYLFNLGGLGPAASGSPCDKSPSLPPTHYGSTLGSPSRNDYNELTLKVVPYDHWERFSPIGFTEARDLSECTRLLNVAEKALKDGVKKFNLRAVVTRKERAVGVSPGGSRAWVAMGSGARKIKSEILEELVCLVRDAVTVEHCTIPYCAFNGGSDVWVDVGNKAIALQVMKKLLDVKATECMHIGDQFTEFGNDTSVRNESPCIWVLNPSETKAILRRICRNRNIKHNVNNLNDFGEEEDSDDKADESD